MRGAAQQLRLARVLHRLDDKGLRRFIEEMPKVDARLAFMGMGDIGRHVMSRAAYDAIHRIVETYTLMEFDALMARGNVWQPRDPRVDPGARATSGIRAVVLSEEPTCAYWGLRADCLGPGTPNVDHKLPRSLGGGNERPNLQRLCQPCNLWKHTKTDAEARSLLAVTLDRARKAASA